MEKEYSLPIDVVLQEQKTSLQGLSTQEAEEHEAVPVYYGPAEHGAYQIKDADDDQRFLTSILFCRLAAEQCTDYCSDKGCGHSKSMCEIGEPENLLDLSLRTGDHCRVKTE